MTSGIDLDLQAILDASDSDSSVAKVELPNGLSLRKGTNNDEGDYGVSATTTKALRTSQVSALTEYYPSQRSDGISSSKFSSNTRGNIDLERILREKDYEGDSDDDDDDANQKNELQNLLHTYRASRTFDDSASIGGSTISTRYSETVSQRKSPLSSSGARKRLSQDAGSSSTSGAYLLHADLALLVWNLPTPRKMHRLSDKCRLTAPAGVLWEPAVGPI